MWYRNSNGKKDGLESLLNYFKSEEEFIKYFFSSTLFFTSEMVKKQAKEIKSNIEKGEKIPVRYTLRSREHFFFENITNQKGKSSKTFKNKKEAQLFSEKNDLYHEETKIKVKIDKDGNYYVRRNILEATGYIVSQGAISDMSNYVISHIWGKTANPYFFTSLWNVILVPNHLSFILDKPDSNSEIVRKLKIIAKAIAIYLYNPNEIWNNIVEDKEDKILLGIELAKKMEKEKPFNFIDVKSESKVADVIEEIKHIQEDSSLKESNQKFIFRILEQLKSVNFDFTATFTNSELCKELFGMKYPILLDISNLTDSEIKEKTTLSGKERYYSYNKTGNKFSFKGKEYLVSNDWYSENRIFLVEWLTGNEIE